MAKTLRQVVVQETQPTVEKRNIIQFIDDTLGTEGQIILNYEDMTAEEKVVYDEFISLCTNKMNE